MTKQNKKKKEEKLERLQTKDFFDCIAPGVIRFMPDYYIVGDSYRSVWAIREYPPITEQQAIFSRIADRTGVTLRIYHRLVEAIEQRKIIQNATRKNKMKSTGNDINDTVEAESNLQDVIELLSNMRKNREILLHCSVFIELKARNIEKLRELQGEIMMELARSKISVDIFNVTVDTIAPELVINGVENGGKTKTDVVITEVSEPAEIKVYLNDTEIEYQLGDKLTQAGQYRVKAMDECGNCLEYAFEISKGLNGGIIALIVISCLVVVGGAITVIILKRKNVF